MVNLQDQNEPTEAELLKAVAESNGIIAVALMRVYDVLMCMYGETDATDAVKLINEHKAGKIRSDFPWLKPD